MFYPVNEFKMLKKLISNCCMFYEMEISLTHKKNRLSTYVVTLWRVRVRLLAWKEITIKYYVSVSVFFSSLSGTQITSFLRRIIFSPVACLAVSHFSTFSHKRQDFREKTFECFMYVLMSSTNLAVTFLILRRIQRDIIKMCTCLSVKCCYSCQILTKHEFSRKVFEKCSNSNIKFMKIRREVTELSL